MNAPSSRQERTITLTRPDDWHLHLRDGELLRTVLPHTARRFARAIVMPNLQPPVVDVAQAALYRERILAALPEGADFTPLMTLYLTDRTEPEEIGKAAKSGFVHAVKLYPAGATTHSSRGVTRMEGLDSVFAALAETGLPLLAHGEVTDSGVDIFDRERVFVERVLSPLCKRFPRLKVVLEHVTTAEAVAFVEGAGENVAATLTAHHLLYNRNAIFQGGLRPHWYCLPVLKRERHRQALARAAVSGNPKFFLGTDSAPHAQTAKEAACGCAGCYTAAFALELYAEAFAAADALDRLEAFASFHGADFYGLPRNRETVTLIERPQVVPEVYPYRESGQDGASFSFGLIPFRAGETLNWSLSD
ncbi:MAG: dihydroorotase [Zoogloeaceae bacterium]|jgi:dihydroorotase|nr:dihydroorotase [Zoogloeaceae bacterium]